MFHARPRRQIFVTFFALIAIAAASFVTFSVRAAEKARLRVENYDIDADLNPRAHTLTAKAKDLELSNIGLELKSVVEQFREQVQNLE